MAVLKEGLLQHQYGRGAEAASILVPLLVRQFKMARQFQIVQEGLIPPVSGKISPLKLLPLSALAWTQHDWLMKKCVSEQRQHARLCAYRKRGSEASQAACTLSSKGPGT